MTAASDGGRRSGTGAAGDARAARRRRRRAGGRSGDDDHGRRRRRDGRGVGGERGGEDRGSAGGGNGSTAGRGRGRVGDDGRQRGRGAGRATARGADERADTPRDGLTARLRRERRRILLARGGRDRDCGLSKAPRRDERTAGRPLRVAAARRREFCRVSRRPHCSDAP